MTATYEQMLEFLDEMGRRQAWEAMGIAERALTGMVSVATLLRLDPELGFGPLGATASYDRVTMMSQGAAIAAIGAMMEREAFEVEIDIDVAVHSAPERTP